MILGGQVLNAVLWFPVPSFRQLPKRWDRWAGVTTRAAKKATKEKKGKQKKKKRKKKKRKKKKRKRRKRVKEKKEGFPQEAIWYRVKDIG
jgi:hypothetical protein